jgi:hypothetical protein
MPRVTLLIIGCHTIDLMPALPQTPLNVDLLGVYSGKLLDTPTDVGQNSI